MVKNIRNLAFALVNRPQMPRRLLSRNYSSFKIKSPLITSSHVLNQIHNENQNENSIDIEKQTRLANLGSLIEIIKENVPNMLNTTLPKTILSNDITLNFLPDSHPHIPSVVGRVPYTTTVKLLQFLVSTLLIPPSSKLMILSARTDSLSGITRYSYYRTQDHEKKTAVKEKDKDEGEGEGEGETASEHPHHHHHNHYNRHLNNTHNPRSLSIPPRFIVYWRTVSPEDYDSKTNYNDSQEYFPYSWSSSLAREIDPVKIARTLGILPHEYPVLTGIFEFEFDEICSTIITHTITDLQYLTKPTTECINPA